MDGMIVRLSGLIVIALMAYAQDNQIGRGVNFFSREKEATLGAELAEHLRSQTKAVDSVPVRAFVEQLGSRLAAQIPGSPLKYTFGVVANPLGGLTAEPVWFPGGSVFVPAGLFLQCANEAEFVGMLAHAMAHIAARHGTRLATRGQLMNQTTVPLIFMGGWGGEGSLMVPEGLARYYRQYELDADRLAVRLAGAAGYDPGALAQYVARTQAVESESSRGTSMKPNREARLDNLRQAADGLSMAQFLSAGDFAALQDEVRELIKVPEPKRPTLRRPDRP